MAEGEYRAGRDSHGRFRWAGGWPPTERELEIIAEIRARKTTGTCDLTDPELEEKRDDE